MTPSSLAPFARRFEAIGVLVVLSALASSGLLGGAFFLPATAVGAVVGLIGAYKNMRSTAQAGLLLLAILCVHASLPRTVWPLHHLLVVAVYALLLWRVPALRGHPRWLRRGVVGRREVWGIIGFSLASGFALVVWRFTTTVDLSAFRSFVPSGVPLWLVPPGLLAFACLNAAYEELVWRGVIQDGLEVELGSKLAAGALQAVAFGLWHFRGFPSGWVGVGLTTVFALMMGALRTSSRGLFAPWLAHVAADATIFTLVVVMVLA